MSVGSKKIAASDVTFSPILQSRQLKPIPIEDRSSGASIWVPNLRLERKDAKIPPSDTRGRSTKSGGDSLRFVNPVIREERISKGDRMAAKLKRGGVANYNALRETASSSNSFHSTSQSFSSNRSSSVIFSHSETIPPHCTSPTSSILPSADPPSKPSFISNPPYPAFHTGVSDPESVSKVSSSFMPVTPNASSFPGFMEGPLPSEVREIIRSTCSRERAEEAEMEARRLLSTSRRIKVYRDEMKAAMEEWRDAKVECDRQELVTTALCDEARQLSAKIEALQKEKSICEDQITQVQKVGLQRQKKLEHAQERVQLLRNTIDNINRETSMGHLFLRQAVPNLNIENYA